VKRILHILPQFQPGGGMERVVMNYFSQLNHDEFSFDVVTHKMEDRAYADDLSQEGGETFVFPPMSLGNMRDVARRFNNLLDERHYDVIHCHMANGAFIYLRIAKRHGIPIRILHSHQDHYADTWSHALRNIPLIAMGKRYANRHIACSEAAGAFLFGKGNYTVLTNGIDVESFRFSEIVRDESRNNLGFSERQAVFGFVGRLAPQKNPLFVLDVFAACRKSFSNCKLVIAGDGELHEKMLLHGQELGVSDDIVWLGNVSNVSQIYQGLDILLMPSVYEGLPMTLVEAQAAGIRCYVSDTITEEAVISQFVAQESIDQPPEVWARRIISDLDANGLGDRAVGAQQVIDSGFDIRSSVKILKKVYLN
jgi:glycosyltransferase involved in cell wall biosynthesis